MPKDPTIAIRDCLAEIAILREIASRATLQTFQADPIARRAASYAIQTISEPCGAFPTNGLRTSLPSRGNRGASATAFVTNTFGSTTPSCGRS